MDIASVITSFGYGPVYFDILVLIFTLLTLLSFRSLKCLLNNVS